MIDVMQTAIGERVKKTKLLFDSLAWQKVIDADIRRKILTMIQQHQLMRSGIDSTGKVIGYYSWMTEAMSKGRKKEGQPYNLYDTGEFYKQMFVVALNDGLLVDSDGADKEDTNLFREYGDNIVGLTDENLGKLVEALRPKYIEYVRKTLGID